MASRSLSTLRLVSSTFPANIFEDISPDNLIFCSNFAEIFACFLWIDLIFCSICPVSVIVAASCYLRWEIFWFCRERVAVVVEEIYCYLEIWF